jgi:hypothetical protein
MGGKGSGRKKSPLHGDSSREGAGRGVPPSLTQSEEDLKKQAAELAGGSPEGGEASLSGKRGPGRPRKAPVVEIQYPIEAITQVHKGIWDWIAASMKSEYRLSEQGAHEMAVYADLCLRQYVTPVLAEHACLAAYLFSQVTALSVCVLMRKGKKDGPSPGV